MNNIRQQIIFIEGQLEDIDFILGRADAGYEVGDTNKLEMEKEKLQNKLQKLIQDKKKSIEKITKEIKKEKIEEIPPKIPTIKNEEFNINNNKGSKKIFIKMLIGLSLIAMGICMGVSEVENENKEIKKENEEIKSCYNILLDEDYIKPGCEEYFKEDKWYIEYLNEVKY